MIIFPVSTQIQDITRITGYNGVFNIITRITGYNGVFMCIYKITGSSAIVATLVHDGFMNPVDG